MEQTETFRKHMTPTVVITSYLHTPTETCTFQVFHDRILSRSHERGWVRL